MGYPTDCLCVFPFLLVSDRRLADLLLYACGPPAVPSTDWLSPARRNSHVSTANGSPGCIPDQNPARVSHLVSPICLGWIPADVGLYLDRTLVLVVYKKSEYSESCLLVVLPPSISSVLKPPELYSGHGHQM